MKVYINYEDSIHLVDAEIISEHPNGVEFAIGNETLVATNDSWHLSLADAEAEVASRG